MSESEHHVFQLPEVPESEGPNEPGTMRVIEVDAGGVVSESVFVMPPDLVERLEQARDYWAELKEAGTPYWCIHEDRSVTHERAYWKDDTPDDPIHRKHGVMCRDCGGYIQEG